MTITDLFAMKQVLSELRVQHVYSLKESSELQGLWATVRDELEKQVLTEARTLQYEQRRWHGEV
jgi:hypothetical protein